MLTPMIILLAVLAALVVMIVLYRRARLRPLFAESLAFPMIVVFRPVAVLQTMLERCADYCNEVVDKSLRYPPQVAGDLVGAIARTILFLESSIILIGYWYNTLLRSPILFGGDGVVDLGVSFAIPSSLLFITMAALYGEIAFLECTNITPESSHLFPKLSEKARKWLGIFCAVGFILSLAFEVLFWVIGAYYTSVDTSIPPSLVIPTMALVGLILAGASVLALWGLVIGMLGLTSLVFWLLTCVFRLLAAPLAILLSPIEGYVQYITQGRKSIYVDLLGHKNHKPPDSPFTDAVSIQVVPTTKLLPGEPDTAILPEHATAIDADNDNVQVFPVLTPHMEKKIMNPDKSSAILGVGRFGSEMLPAQRVVIDRLHATDSFLASFLVDPNSTHLPTAIPGLIDCSPPPTRRLGLAPHSETEGQFMHALLTEAVDCLVETMLPVRTSPGTILANIDSHNLVDFVEPAETIKRRFPLHKLVVCTEVSESDWENKAVLTGLADFQALVLEDIVETINFTYKTSHFARLYGRQIQHLSLAQLWVSLVMAHRQSVSNPPCPNLLSTLHHLSPFTSVSFASEPIAVGELPRRFSWLPGLKGKTGVGNYSDVRTQTQAAIGQVLTSEASLAFPTPALTEKACIILTNEPVTFDSDWFGELVRDNAQYCSTHARFATSVTVSRNAISLPHSAVSPFRVQASGLFCLSPSVLPPLQTGKQENLTPLDLFIASSAPVKQNGHEPVINRVNGAKASRVVSNATKAVTKLPTKKAQVDKSRSRKNAKVGQ